MAITIAQLAAKIGGEVRGHADVSLDSIANLSKAKPNQLSFLSNSKFIDDLQSTQAGAVILTAKDAETFSGNAIIHENPYLGYALAAQALDTTPVQAQEISPQANIHPTATLGKNASIGAGAVICANVVMGDDCVIGPNAFIGEEAHLGNEVKIKANASIQHRVILKDKVVIQSGAVIGGDGFGYANDKGQWIKIPQTGRVIVGENTEIGNNTCIDRGALDDTIIGKNCIIDNLVHIAHNCVIGDHCCICGSVGIAGSATLGNHVVIAGHCGINGHISITDNVQITGKTMVTKSITESGVYSSGMPAMSNRDWQKNTVKLRTIDKLYARVKQLEKSSQL